jgi:hypothetical protein
VFDSSIQASFVRLISRNGPTTLRGTIPTARLFEVSAGAPSVELQGFRVQSPLLVSGGALALRDCKFEPESNTQQQGGRRGLADTDPLVPKGGAILITAGSLTAEDSNFTGNHAEYGGALYASGGEAKFVNCIFDSNDASVHGGAIALTGDATHVVLSSGSLLVNNMILADAQTPQHNSAIYRGGGSLSYVLPDPCDRWVDSPGGQKTSVPVETGKSLTSDYPVSCAAGRFGNST